MAGHLLQPSGSSSQLLRLMLDKAVISHNQDRHFFIPKGDLQVKTEKMALCPYFPVHPNWKEHVGSALYLLVSVCLLAEKEDFLYLQQNRSLQRYLEKLEKCRKYKYLLLQAQDLGIFYFMKCKWLWIKTLRIVFYWTKVDRSKTIIAQKQHLFYFLQFPALPRFLNTAQTTNKTITF